MIRQIRCGLIAIGLLGIMLLGGCSFPLQLDLTQLKTDDRVSHWLNGVPCKAPCWEGITPGQTTDIEAIQLLEQNPLIDHKDFPASISDEGIEWAWSDNRFGGGTLHYRRSGIGSSRVVDWMLIDLRNPVYLHEVIKAYGEPSHILAYKFNGLHGDGPFYMLWLIYQPQGFMLNTGFVYDHQPRIDSNLEFYKLYFFGTSEALGELGVAAAVPWEGFKNFAYYCQDDEDGKLCQEDK